MARTIDEIHRAIIADMNAQGLSLSTSKVAEWRLWTRIMALAIYAFEVILDQFRREIDHVADKITPGTVRWYVEQCKKFQNGHQIKFNPDTAQLYYEKEAPEARIIDIVAITEGANRLAVKVAKLNTENKIVPLTDDELYNFSGYVDSIKFAGIETSVISTTADKIRYNIEVFFEPSVPVTVVRQNVLNALNTFRSALDFNSILYRGRLIDAVMAVKGVVTADLKALQQKGTSIPDFTPVGVSVVLESGYFDYDTNCVLTFTSIKSM